MSRANNLAVAATRVAASPAAATQTLSPRRARRGRQGAARQVPARQHRSGRRQEPADPIDILRESDAGRLKELVPIRYGRMLQSPFTFYRGAAGVMAADLAQTPTTGFKVQACGDCHLVNFGGFATPERNVIFDINDFDETCRRRGNGTSSGWWPRSCWPRDRSACPTARAAIAR